MPRSPRARSNGHDNLPGDRRTSGFTQPVLTPAELDRLYAGDPAFFRTLHHTHTPALLEQASRVTDRADDAQDVVQETWVRVFAYRHQFTGGSLAGWIHTIARTVGVDYHRSNRRRTKRHTLFTALRDIEPADPLESRSMDETWRTRGELIDAILHLTPRQRDAVVFCFLAERSTENTAKAMGVTTSTVRVLVHQAVRALRQRNWRIDNFTLEDDNVL